MNIRRFGAALALTLTAFGLSPASVGNVAHAELRLGATGWPPDASMYCARTVPPSSGITQVMFAGTTYVAGPGYTGFGSTRTRCKDLYQIRGYTYQVYYRTDRTIDWAAACRMTYGNQARARGIVEVPFTTITRWVCDW